MQRFSTWRSGSGYRRTRSFAEKLENVVGLYVDPPAHAVVLSVDEKGQIQALDRTQPGLPMKPGRAGTMTHDYKLNLENCISERATGTGVYGTDQCASSSALKLVIPESNDPVIAVVASTPRGKSTLVIEARKIAAIGRAMTK